MAKTGLKALIVTLISGGLLSACAPSGGGSGGGAGPQDPNKPSAGPFSAMVMKTAGSCDDVSKLRFINNVNLQNVKIGEQGRKDIVLQIALQILDNGNYFAVYSEVVPDEVSDSSATFEPIFFTNIEGRWIAKGDELTLEGLGYAKLAKAGDQKILNLKIQTRINNPEAMNPVIALTPVAIPLGPKGETPEDFCNGK